MVNKLSTIKDRALQVAETHKVAKDEFCISIGMTYGNFKGKAKESPLNSDAIAKILTMYPDVDPRWLVTGEGSMNGTVDMGKATIEKIGNRRASGTKKEAQAVPLYEIEASAGIVDLIHTATPQKHVPIDYIHIPNLPQCDGGLRITGDSMYPLLKSGDIVLYKEVKNMTNIIWGEMYLVAISHEGDNFFFAKYVQRSKERPEWVRLVSQNVHHQDVEFPIQSIQALALIKASIRFNTAY